MNHVRDLLTRPRRSTRNDSGLALLDVLLGMAIFALIVIIALQAIGQFRQRAYQTAVTSDAQQVGVALEAYYSDGQSYPAALDAAMLTKMGANTTKGVVISEYVPTSGTVTFCAQHYSGTTADAYARYDSAKGGLTESGRGRGCAKPVNRGTGTVPCPGSLALRFVPVGGASTDYYIYYDITDVPAPAGNYGYYYRIDIFSGNLFTEASSMIQSGRPEFKPGATIKATASLMRNDTYEASSGCDPVSVTIPN